MGNLLKVLQALYAILLLAKDSDGDGKLDIFDKEPDNPEVK